MTLGDFAQTFTREFTPGPGAYSTESYRSVGDKYSVKCNIRPKYGSKPPLTSEIDYPKEYSSLSRNAKTISPKYPTHQVESTPGPEFLPDPMEHFNKKIVIKKRYADPDTSIYPGPGQYSPGDLPKTKVPPMVGRSKIILSDIPESPGPAAYDVLHKIGDSPKYTIRPKTATSGDRSLNPGIAYNHPAKIGDSTPRWSFSRAKRDSEPDRKVPGPGAYQQPMPRDTKLAPRIRPKSAMREREYYDVPIRNSHEFPQIQQKTIGIKTENEFWGSKNKNPGPSYMSDSTIHQRSLTIGEKFKKKDIQDTPGPSDYNPHVWDLPNQPVYSMKGPLVRDDWLPKKGDEPSPAEYSNQSTENNMPRWIIGERSVIRTNRSMSSQREIRTGRKSNTRNSYR